jgi:NACHT domain
LQSELAECVRQSKKRVSSACPGNIQTLFTSTIRRLVNFPKVKDAYVLPLITVRGTDTCWNLERDWAKLLMQFLQPEKLTESTKVTPPYRAWLMVAPAGQGKTRFTHELAKMINARERHWQVLRVSLRRHIKYLESCYPNNIKQLDKYIEHFAKSCNLDVSTNKNLVFIFDGYEQVYSLYGSVLDKLFKRISINRHPMLLTTRPNAVRDATKSQVSLSMIFKIPV